jgi:glyoxylase-like metal-dependent hydrolase (beta-lactamase superfamily II)
MQRRQFIKSSSTLAGLFPFLQNDGLNRLSTNLFMNADLVRFDIGQFRCTIFLDLMFKYLAKDFFINADPEQLNQSLKEYKVVAENIASPFIALLVERDDRKVLIDTGIGFSEEPIVFRGASHEFKGQFHFLLQRENIKKEEITDVIITHFHPDHVGGIYSEHGQLNFPNAQFYLHEDEWNYWHSSRSDNQPGMFKLFIEKNITGLKEQNLQLIKGDFVELLPGITAVKADGHTPGQIALIIHSGDKRLLYISDAFLHPLHIEHLDWQTNYDLDHQKAKLSRIKLVDLARKEDMLVNAFHFDIYLSFHGQKISSVILRISHRISFI